MISLNKFKRHNENQFLKRELMRYQTPIYFKIVQRKKRKEVTKLILFVSSIALMMISVFTGKFEFFMNYLINELLKLI